MRAAYTCQEPPVVELMDRPDYLCIGHVTRDLIPGGSCVGGTVTYSALTAQALGRRPGIITSADSDYDLDLVFEGIPITRVSSATTTTFQNRYTAAGRRQTIRSVAEHLGAESIPNEWRRVPILHLGPVAREVDPRMTTQFDSQVIGLTPQGWHRRWDSRGRVGFSPWSLAADVLPLASAVIVSLEDIRDDQVWALYRKQSRLLVITDGAVGCEVIAGGECRRFRPPPVPEVDPTGVGDIFAAAFFVRLWETGGDPWESARFATAIAAPTVARRGLQGIPTAVEVAAARAGSS